MTDKTFCIQKSDTELWDKYIEWLNKQWTYGKKLKGKNPIWYYWLRNWQVNWFLWSDNFWKHSEITLQEWELMLINQ